MPSIWIKETGYIGGCNDGPGIVPLHKWVPRQSCLPEWTSTMRVPPLLPTPCPTLRAALLLFRPTELQ